MILQAIQKKYEAEMDAALANIDVYMNHPAGIGEHPDIVEAVETQVKRYTEALEMFEAIDRILESV